MKYLSLLLLSVLFIPVIQVAHAQNILEQIGEVFMGGNETNETNETNQTSSNASSASSGNETSSNASSASSGNETSSNASSASSGNETSSNASSASSGNETSTGIGSIEELQNLTSGNQEILANGTDIGSNVSLGQGMEMEQE
jgi:hypothetical protein